MNIKRTAEDKALTVALEGRLDTVTSPELDRTLEPVLDGVEELVLELADLEYVSSAGLRVILKLQKHMAKQGILKKDSIVDTISAMEFCFLYEKRLIFALLPLNSAVSRAFFLVKTINPPSAAPQRQKWRILYRSRSQSFKD